MKTINTLFKKYSQLLKVTLIPLILKRKKNNNYYYYNNNNAFVYLYVSGIIKEIFVIIFYGKKFHLYMN